MTTLKLSVPVTLPASILPIPPRDIIINENTRMLFDFSQTDTYPSQAAVVPTGTTIKNLITGGSDAVTVIAGSSSMSFSSDKHQLKLNPANANDCNLTLGSSGVFTGTTKGFLITIWFSHYAPTVSASDTMVVLAYTYQATVYNQYLIQCHAGAKKYSIRANGVVIADNIAFPADGTLIQFAISYDATTGAMKDYRDGAVIGTASSSTTLNNPLNGNAGTNVKIATAGGYTPGFNGAIKRVWAEESIPGSTHATQVYRDYVTNYPRLNV